MTKYNKISFWDIGKPILAGATIGLFIGGLFGICGILIGVICGAILFGTIAGIKLS